METRLEYNSHNLFFIYFRVDPDRAVSSSSEGRDWKELG